MNLRLYTDGACSRNGQAGAVGGWAYVVVNEQDSILLSGKGRVEGATNQQMELTALTSGVDAVINQLSNFFSCQCYSDSAYCINAINDGWIEKWRHNGWQTSAKADVKNQDYWRALYTLYSNDDRLTFVKVKGHAGDQWNTYVDNMAVRAKDGDYDFQERLWHMR